MSAAGGRITSSLPECKAMSRSAADLSAVVEQDSSYRYELFEIVIRKLLDIKSSLEKEVKRLQKKSWPLEANVLDETNLLAYLSIMLRHQRSYSLLTQKATSQSINFLRENFVTVETIASVKKALEGHLRFSFNKSKRDRSSTLRDYKAVIHLLEILYLIKRHISDDALGSRLALHSNKRLTHLLKLGVQIASKDKQSNTTSIVKQMHRDYKSDGRSENRLFLIKGLRDKTPVDEDSKDSSQVKGQQSRVFVYEDFVNWCSEEKNEASENTFYEWLNVKGLTEKLKQHLQQNYMQGMSYFLLALNDAGIPTSQRASELRSVSIIDLPAQKMVKHEMIPVSTLPQQALNTPPDGSTSTNATLRERMLRYDYGLVFVESMVTLNAAGKKEFCSQIAFGAPCQVKLLDSDPEVRAGFTIGDCADDLESMAQQLSWLGSINKVDASFKAYLVALQDALNNLADTVRCGQGYSPMQEQYLRLQAYRAYLRLRNLGDNKDSDYALIENVIGVVDSLDFNVDDKSKVRHTKETIVRAYRDMSHYLLKNHAAGIDAAKFNRPRVAASKNPMADVAAKELSAFVKAEANDPVAQLYFNFPRVMQALIELSEFEDFDSLKRCCLFNLTAVFKYLNKLNGLDVAAPDVVRFKKAIYKHLRVQLLQLLSQVLEKLQSFRSENADALIQHAQFLIAKIRGGYKAKAGSRTESKDNVIDMGSLNGYLTEAMRTISALAVLVDSAEDSRKQAQWSTLEILMHAKALMDAQPKIMVGDPIDILGQTSAERAGQPSGSKQRSSSSAGELKETLNFTESQLLAAKVAYKDAFNRINETVAGALGNSSDSTRNIVSMDKARLLALWVNQYFDHQQLMEPAVPPEVSKDIADCWNDFCIALLNKVKLECLQKAEQEYNTTDKSTGFQDSSAANSAEVDYRLTDTLSLAGRLSQAIKSYEKSKGSSSVDTLPLGFSKNVSFLLHEAHCLINVKSHRSLVSAKVTPAEMPDSKSDLRDKVIAAPVPPLSPGIKKGAIVDSAIADYRQFRMACLNLYRELQLLASYEPENADSILQQMQSLQCAFQLIRKPVSAPANAKTLYAQWQACNELNANWFERKKLAGALKRAVQTGNGIAHSESGKSIESVSETGDVVSEELNKRLEDSTGMIRSFNINNTITLPNFSELNDLTRQVKLKNLHYKSFNALSTGTFVRAKLYLFLVNIPWAVSCGYFKGQSWFSVQRSYLSERVSGDLGNTSDAHLSIASSTDGGSGATLPDLRSSFSSLSSSNASLGYLDLDGHGVRQHQRNRASSLAAPLSDKGGLSSVGRHVGLWRPRCHSAPSRVSTIKPLSREQRAQF